MDTIFAPATGAGKTGISVFRISGPGAWAAGRALTGPLPAPRKAVLRKITHDGALIDEALVIAFAEGESFTGEQSLELHTHGSPAVRTALSEALSAQPGLRPAEPGEFTRRALENDRLDLTEVEGLADLIDAETEHQRRQAVALYDGALRGKVEEMRAKMLRAAALIEATIDFADEEVPEDVAPEVSALLTGLLTDLQAEARGVDAAERLREGFEVAIIGPPNSGKSTLLNRLAGREAAITSEIAGTTRDVIEVRMDLRGLPVTFLDTAGLRETEDTVENIGISRARARAESADLLIVLGEVPGFATRDGDLVATPKADLLSDPSGLAVSGLTGQGIDGLIDQVVAVFETRVQTIGTATTQRHKDGLRAAIGSLEAVDLLLQGGSERQEEIAEHLRVAARSMESIIGRLGVEDLLGEIFSSFCIGK